jgi:hypothetical protein
LPNPARAVIITESIALGMPKAFKMTVIRQSRAQRDGLLGGLVLVLGVAFGLGAANAHTTGGRIAALIVGSAIVLLLLQGWIRLIVRPSRLEVSAEAITLVGPNGERATLSRESGSQLTVITIGGGRVNNRGLTIAGTGSVVSLATFFSLKQVKRQCLAYGWTFSTPR